MRSVILKPQRFIPKPTQIYPSKQMDLSLRQATAIVASAAANGLRLDNAVRVPRRVEVDGVKGYVENGVSCDLLTSKSITLVSAANPADEMFELDEAQVRRIIGLVGLKKCADLGVLQALDTLHP